MAHDDVTSLADLKDKTDPGRDSRHDRPGGRGCNAKYGITDEQTRPYTFNLQPFFADKNMVQQSYPSSEPFQAKQQNVPVKFFLFARRRLSALRHDHGHDRAASSNKNPDVAARFVKASLEGWKSYFNDPAPGNALIKADNPKMSDAQIAFATRAAQGAQGRSTAATPRPWASASSRRRAGKRPTTSWSRPACSSPKSTGRRPSPTGS